MSEQGNSIAGQITQTLVVSQWVNVGNKALKGKLTDSDLWQALLVTLLHGIVTYQPPMQPVRYMLPNR